MFAFINATILDGTCDMEPQRGMSVLADKGRIVRIEPAATAQLPAEAEVIDLHDSYLLPGLINMHVHFAARASPCRRETPATSCAAWIMLLDA